MTVGIQHLQVYIPGRCVAKQDAVPFSLYPRIQGDASERLTVLPTDEDVVSMALTVVRDLMERTGIGWESVGMIQVGTSTNVDRTKPIQSYICGMFNQRGGHDIIGGDNTFACNSGMNALMHVATWMSSPLWNGKLGLVVTADHSHTATAIHYPYDRVWNGAAACAAVIAPDGMLGIESYDSRTCHNFTSTRPAATSPWRSYPEAGGAEAFERFYDRELIQIVQSWKRKHGVTQLADAFDYFAIHDVTPSRIRKAFATIMQADGAEPDRWLAKLAPSLSFFRHTQHVGVSNVLLYIAGIVASAAGRRAPGSRVFCLGEGSGFQTSILTLRGDVGGVSLNDVRGLLDRAVPLTWWEYHDLCEEHLDVYGRPRPSVAKSRSATAASGPIRVASVDVALKRRYESLTPDSSDRVEWPGALFKTIAGMLLILDVPLLIVPVMYLWGYDVSRSMGWTEVLNLISATSTLIWRALVLVAPDALYPEMAYAIPFTRRRYRLNMRSFSYFAIAVCAWSFLHPADHGVTAFWLSYFVFRQLNQAITLHRMETVLYAHDAVLMTCYLVAMDAGVGAIVTAVVGSLVVGGWRGLSRAVLSRVAWRGSGAMSGDGPADSAALR